MKVTLKPYIVEMFKNETIINILDTVPGHIYLLRRKLTHTQFVLAIRQAYGSKPHFMLIDAVGPEVIQFPGTKVWLDVSYDIVSDLTEYLHITLDLIGM